MSFKGVLIIVVSLIAISFVSAEIVISENTENIRAVETNFDTYYTGTFEPIEGTITVLFPPKYEIVSSSIAPTKVEKLVEKTFFNLITVYKGVRVEFSSNTPVEITYTQSSSINYQNSLFLN